MTTALGMEEYGEFCDRDSSAGIMTRISSCCSFAFGKNWRTKTNALEHI